MCNQNCNQGRNCDCKPRPDRGVGNLLLAIQVVFWIVAIILLSGCTAIGHKPPPADWPKMAIKIHKVGWYEMQVACGYGGAWTPFAQVFACANMNADTMECNVYLAGDDEYAQLALEHELEHCAGKDHIGSTAISDYWEAWKKENRK